MDYIAYRRLSRNADHVDTTSFQVNAGAINRTMVTLDRFVSSGMDGEEEVEWVVTDQAANPPRHLLHTTDESMAHRTYADEIDRVRKGQGEQVLSRR